MDYTSTVQVFLLALSTASSSLTSPPQSSNATRNPPLSTPSHAAFLCSSRQHVVDDKVCRLNGSARCVATTFKALPLPRKLTVRTAKPSTALMAYRAGSAAFISSTSSKPAAPVTQKPGLVAGNPGTPPPMRAARREVPLPSQEGKKGAMQYALYVAQTT